MVLPVSATDLLLAKDLRRSGLSDRALQREADAGRLIRIRRGAYCPAERWQALDDRQRHLLRMRAVAEASGREVVFCGLSAAAAWNLPLVERFPGDVEVVGFPSSGGGRSQGDVRRRPLQTTGLRVNERDGLLVTGVASTAVQLALQLGFADAVGVLDRALWGRNPDRIEFEELVLELERIGPRYRRSAALAAILFAVGASDSLGESIARARLHELGYPPPVLQAPLADERGLIGRVDFYWPDHGIIGEFDGAVKYQRTEMLGGRSPAETVWREKQREDRLRRRCAGLFRAVWADLMDPPRFDAIVRSSGLRPSARV